VFASAFSLGAAEAVVSDDQVDVLDVLDALAGLVAKSMVTLDDSGAADSYRLTETMRDYGHQLLAERDDLHRFEERHAAYYGRLAEEAAVHLVGPDDRFWRARLASEYGDLRAALMFLRDRPEPAGFVNLVYALTPYWTQQGLHWEGVEWILQVIDLPTDKPTNEQAARVGFAGLAAASRDYERGAALVERSLAISAAAGEPPTASALNALAFFAVVSDRPDDVLRESEAAIAAARATSDLYMLCDIISSAGNFIALVVDDERAIELADEGLTLARRLGNRYLLGMNLAAAGMARYRSDPRRALEFFQESLDTGLINQARNPQTHFFMAIVNLRLRDVAAAAQEICIALPSMQERGEPYYESMALAMAAIILARRDPDLSVRILALVDRLREEGLFIGATRDLEAQQILRERLEAVLPGEHFAAQWAEGRAGDLDTMIAIALDELAAVANAADSGS